MSQIAFTTAAEEQYAATLERQGRLRLVNRISRILMGLGSLYLLLFVAFTVLVLVPNGPFASLLTDAWQTPLLVAADAVVGVAFALAILAGIAARRGRVDVAANTIIAAAGLGLTSTEIVFAVIPALQMVAHAGIAALIVVMVIAYILGEDSTLLISTAGINVVSLIIIVLSNSTFGGMGMGFSLMSNAQLQLLIPQTLLAEWIVTALLLTIGRVYRQNLTALNQSRIELDRAQKLDDLKNQFIANVNHELRTPIMALQMLLKTSLLTLDHLSAEEIREMLAQSTRVSGNLAALIESILSLSRIDQQAQSLSIKPVPVRAALDTAIELIDPLESGSEERELRLHMDQGITLMGDVIAVQQIMTNLLSNARKYSAHGTPIEIRAHLQQPDAAQKSTEATAAPRVEIVVRDYGLGVPPEQQAFLFNRFVRLPRDLASNVIGNGLGLYLCRELAEAMGGRIWVESTGIEGDGSTFHLELPAAVEVGASR